MPTVVFYSPYGDHGEGDCRHSISLVADYDLRDGSWNDSIIEQCAADWFSNHGGFEASWPRVFTLYADKRGPALARMVVSVEPEPAFHAQPFRFAAGPRGE
jgi:hypothetical protein